MKGITMDHFCTFFTIIVLWIMSAVTAYYFTPNIVWVQHKGNGMYVDYGKSLYTLVPIEQVTFDYSPVQGKVKK